ncbi:hypothetical protein K439DRAFT_1566183 [Ramaria rubella]|nr:hypothetical protein K439DRAFT_1566183 [Ramaria rubella]
MRRMREEEQREEETQAKVFNFEKEKPQVLGSIVTASQAFSNLVNALMLVTRKLKPIQANTRVQEGLVAAKMIRKQVVCYIQLVEDEELIALGMYNKYLIPDTTDMGIESQLSHTTLTDENASLSELNKLQEKHRSATGNTGVHPDLHDLDFNTLSSDAAAQIHRYMTRAHSQIIMIVTRGMRRQIGAIWQKAAQHGKLWEKARHTGLYQSFSDEDLTGEEAVRRQALLDNGTPGIADKQGMNWS